MNRIRKITLTGLLLLFALLPVSAQERTDTVYTFRFVDFNVGIGCLHADYDKYTVIDDVRVRSGKESKNWWGPINAGVTLVWKIF